jgi:hypothetical protein
MLVQHAHRVGTPWFAQAWGCGKCFGKSLVANGEILCTVVEVAKRRATRAHTAASAVAFFEYSDLVTRLYKGAGTSDTGYACTDNGKVLGAWLANRF